MAKALSAECPSTGEYCPWRAHSIKVLENSQKFADRARRADKMFGWASRLLGLESKYEKHISGAERSIAESERVLALFCMNKEMIEDPEGLNPAEPVDCIIPSALGVEMNITINEEEHGN